MGAPSLSFALAVQCPRCAETAIIRFGVITAGDVHRTTYAGRCPGCAWDVRATVEASAPSAAISLAEAQAHLERARSGGGSHE